MIEYIDKNGRAYRLEVYYDNNGGGETEVLAVLKKAPAAEFISEPHLVYRDMPERVAHSVRKGGRA